MSIRYERVTVTPSMAKKWLELNSENNRNAKTSKIPNYARDMKTGNWNSDTGETIKFDSEGVLIDGANRLRAVVMADVEVDFDVAYDVPTRAMQVIDTGASRTFSDTLIISGVGGSRMQVSSIVRWVILWDAGVYRASGGTFAPTHSELMSRYQASPGIFDAAASRARDLSSRQIATASPLGTAYVLFSRIDKGQTEQFFDHLITGANLPELHPVLTLRNRLMRTKVDRITRPEQLALTIRAWNALRAGQTPRNLIISRTGELTNTNFPQPK